MHLKTFHHRLCCLKQQLLISILNAFIDKKHKKSLRHTFELCIWLLYTTIKLDTNLIKEEIYFSTLNLYEVYLLYYCSNFCSSIKKLIYDRIKHLLINKIQNNKQTKEWKQNGIPLYCNMCLVFWPWHWMVFVTVNIYVCPSIHIKLDNLLNSL